MPKYRVTKVPHAARHLFDKVGEEMDRDMWFVYLYFENWTNSREPFFRDQIKHVPDDTPTDRVACYWSKKPLIGEGRSQVKKRHATKR